MGEAAIDLSTLMVGSEFEEFLVDGGSESVGPVPVVTQPAAEGHDVSPDSLAVVPWTAPPAEDDILPGGVPVAVCCYGFRMAAPVGGRLCSSGPADLAGP